MREKAPKIWQAERIPALNIESVREYIGERWASKFLLVRKSLIRKLFMNLKSV